MDTSDIQEDLKQLKEKFSNPAYPDDLSAIDKMERDAKRALLISNLAEADAVKMIKDWLIRDIERINRILTEDEEQTMEERKHLFFRKNLYQWFLGLFPKAEKKLEGIRRKIADNK